MEDRTLLDGLARKDLQCFETLVERYSRYIAAVVAKVAGGRFNSYDVEEIAGDVLIRLWTDGPRIILRGDSLRPYLAIAARNHTLNALRKRQRIIESELEDDAVSCPSAEALAILRQEKETISGMVQGMGEPDREIFIRRYFYLEKIRDIASRLNMQEKAVTARIRRARDKLRIHYETENP